MSSEPVDEEAWWLDEQSDETFWLSLPSLAEAWDRPEEDAAWAYLQPGSQGENGESNAVDFTS